jgi:hypothetical protein
LHTIAIEVHLHTSCREERRELDEKREREREERIRNTREIEEGAGIGGYLEGIVGVATEEVVEQVDLNLNAGHGSTSTSMVAKWWIWGRRSTSPRCDGRGPWRR